MGLVVHLTNIYGVQRTHRPQRGERVIAMTTCDQASQPIEEIVADCHLDVNPRSMLCPLDNRRQSVWREVIPKGNSSASMTFVSIIFSQLRSIILMQIDHEHISTLIELIHEGLRRMTSRFKRDMRDCDLYSQ